MMREALSKYQPTTTKHTWIFRHFPRFLSHVEYVFATVKQTERTTKMTGVGVNRNRHRSTIQKSSAKIKRKAISDHSLFSVKY